MMMLETNPIGLSEDTAALLCEALNKDLAGLYTLYHQVKKHHWIVEGPNFRDVHLLLDELAAHLLKRADQVAERITALGGYPVSTPVKQQEMACFSVEEEGVFPLRTMLANDLNAYVALIRQVRSHAALALQHGDFGTLYLLQETVADLENDAHHIDHVLQPSTL